MKQNLPYAGPVLFLTDNFLLSYVYGHVARAECAVPTNNITNLR